MLARARVLPRKATAEGTNFIACFYISCISNEQEIQEIQQANFLNLGHNMFHLVHYHQRCLTV